MLNKGCGDGRERQGWGPTPLLPAFLTCTARRCKCVQQRNCRGDGASLVYLHSQESVLALDAKEQRSPERRIVISLVGSESSNANNRRN